MTTALVTTTTSLVLNSFETSLKIGFHLNGELPLVVEELRAAKVTSCRIKIPRRELTPNTRNMTPEEAADAKARVDRANEARRQMVEDFFAEFLTRSTAVLLSRKVKRLVTGFVVMITPGDKYFTLLVEHDIY